MKAGSRIQTAVFYLMVSAAAGAVAQNQAPPVDLTKFAAWTATADEGDFVVGPPYANAPELNRRDGIPHGMVHRFKMNSTDSKMYPGIAKTNPGAVVPYTRGVSVYVPAQYEPGQPAAFLVSQDSMGQGELPTILDNMIADKRLPVMVAVMIDSGGGDAQGSERGLEYDTFSAITRSSSRRKFSRRSPRTTR
jgi:hypothetical protein